MGGGQDTTLELRARRGEGRRPRLLRLARGPGPSAGAVILLHVRRDPGGGAVEGGSAESNGGMREGAPEIPRFLSRGRFVSARIGNDLAGYVCDLDGNGLLLEVRDPSGDCTATSFCRGRASSGSAPKGRLSRGLRNAT